MDQENHVSASDIRIVINEIIRLFGGDRKRMLKVSRTLLQLLREFTREELKRSGDS
jgi:hypothetical protein